MTDVAVYVAVMTAISLIVYTKLSRFFGGMIIFLTGLGILYRQPDDGWIGLIIMGSGFLMIVYSLMSNKN